MHYTMLHMVRGVAACGKRPADDCLSWDYEQVTCPACLDVIGRIFGLSRATTDEEKKT